MKVVIVGGAGFIGINTAKYFLQRAHEVVIIDNLSRKGSQYNVEKLKDDYKFNFVHQDIRDYTGIFREIGNLGNFKALILLAGQVAVTTSVVDPREDFEINALGTFNVLEAVRVLGNKPLVIYASTNKVYGKMEDVGIIKRGGRYE